jgi:hypothetical protein
MGIDTPGATWTDVTVDPAADVPTAELLLAELLLFTASGVAATPDMEEGARGSGSEWAGIPATELPLRTASGASAAPDMEEGAKGVAAGPAEAWLGAKGVFGALATVAGGAAAPDVEDRARAVAARSAPAEIEAVVEAFDAAAVLVALVTAGFAPSAADSRPVAVGDAAAVCSV